MSTCDHLAWLRHVENSDTGEVILEDTGRLGRVIAELPRPDMQSLRTVLFIGTRAKDTALKQIFTQNNIGRRGQRQDINLRVDTASLQTDSPLIFADSSPFVKNHTERSHVLCHDTVSHPASWRPETHAVIDIVYARLLFLFTDVVCLFADDFSSLEAIAIRLMEWADIGSAATGLPATRPRLLLIVSEDVLLSSKIWENLQMTLHSGMGSRLMETFSAIKVFRLGGNYLSLLARYQRLRDEIRKQTDEILDVRRRAACLFSAHHLLSLFRCAIKHTSHTITQGFDFLQASRNWNKLGAEYEEHLISVFKLAILHKTPYEKMASFIASSIIMEAFPPRMHHFSIKYVFSILYRGHCYAALKTCYNDECALYICDEIERSCCFHYKSLQSGYISSSRLHWANTQRLNTFLSPYKSNVTCLQCVRRAPEQHLSCGHSVCYDCIRIFGAAVAGRENRVNLKCIYGDEGQLTVDIKPKTAGVRVLGIDGGGARGVTPLAFMEEIQKLVGHCPLHEMVDLAVGTSSGGLSVIGKFHLRWPTKRCSEIFEALAKRCFQSSNSFFGNISSVLKFIARDAVYNEATLEEGIQEHFTLDRHLFEYVPGAIPGTRVAVTATSHGNTRFIFTNYNGPLSSSSQQAYRLIRPKDINMEPRLWEVARATSAAPIFFKPIQMTIGEFWDGGLAFSSPTELALWEVARIWEGDVVIDIAVSLGTGQEDKPEKSSYSLSRLWHSFMDHLDGERRLRDVMHGLNKAEEQYFLLLNTRLKRPTRLDDISDLQEQRHNIHLSPTTRHDLLHTATAFLVSNLYFELDCPAVYSSGVYYCQGSIRCRGDSHAIMDSLQHLYSGRMEFITGAEVLSTCQLHKDICNVCHRFRQCVTLSLRISGVFCQNISGFPQTMAWFEAQQGFENAFGSPDHDFPGGIRCRACYQVPLEIALTFRYTMISFQPHCPALSAICFIDLFSPGPALPSTQYDWDSDNLSSADIALANGELYIVNNASYPDLNRALRGGGAHNFGIITDMTLRPYSPQGMWEDLYAIAEEHLDALFKAYDNYIKNMVRNGKAHILNETVG
ncbi:hypothetical protein BDV40DRAFT_314745 [Aspergillus tamarii]|uniref:PNPLA domain-containing protein n=1 Tax=Aspergillus tamarii TaxID=41984 RepID=A0A5N6UKT1_ASPTM|nr:hypothetical protein BDV40DRAFT_314745 [Aspergillus tamarii]